MDENKTYVTDKVVDELIEKKIDNYCAHSEDFVIPHELTVTITLNEYRALVTSKANKDTEIHELNMEIIKLRDELEAYKKENDMLTRKIMRMESPDLQADDKEGEA